MVAADIHATTYSKPPVPAEAFEKYRDKWVAIRDGKVVAAADSLEQLSKNDAVKQEDAFYHVPSTSALFY